MKSFAIRVSLFLLAAWAGGNVALAQTDTPANTNQPPTVTRPTNKKYTGKVASVDVQAKTFVLEGPAKDEIQITSKTRITKNKQPATFEVVTVGERVAGVKRRETNGPWIALTVVVGDPRQIPAEPTVK